METVKTDESNTLKHIDFGHKVIPEHTGFTLAHLSDPHLSSPSGVKVKELLNKRMYGYLSWCIDRRFEHHDVVLSALLEDIRSTNPDHIVLTGDLTHLGLPREFLKAQSLLHSLGPPSKVTIIPGNHDTYVASRWENTFRLWSDYMTSDAEQGSSGPGKELCTTFPILRVRSGTALIGVSTAQPTPIFLAVGSIGKVQLEKFENILVETRRRRLLRIVLIHHPPVAGAVSRRKQLKDRAAFQAVLARQGAELILHGHTHYPFFGHLETPFGKVSSIGVSSASAIGRTARRRARYHLFRLRRNGGNLELFLSARVYSPTEQRFVEDGNHRLSLPQTPGLVSREP